MKTHSLYLLTLTLATLLLWLDSTSAYKPGMCPKTPIRVCAELCTADRDCPGDEKCCSNGCGHECTSPLKGITQHDQTQSINKPGMCPKTPIGVCAELCTADRDCPGDEKCCSNGCGHECTSPLKDKPGMCPKTPIGVCAELCTADRDCPGDEKCCSNGCGHECTSPLKDKPGVCPQRPARIGICAERCTADSDCPGDEKCCSNGCGHKCIFPFWKGK
uniref:WAP four-disulfide core domain protein 3 isoform X1 n=1 Tax=Pristiophorus japonicus TaxID=55135 RepID=UPI00398F0646